MTIQSEKQVYKQIKLFNWVVKIIISISPAQVFDSYTNFLHK